MAAFLFLDTAIFPQDVGWRLAFAIGAILGLGILVVRRGLPESPRWLFLHGHEDQAERIVEAIEQEVRRETGADLPEPDEAITVRQRGRIRFRELGRVAVKRYPRRAFLGFALFIGQAFLYNAVTFDLGTILHQFFAVGTGSVPYYMAIFAVSNFLGPLLLGRLIDTVGRKPMIMATYFGSAIVTAILAALLMNNNLTDWSFFALILVTFFRSVVTPFVILTTMPLALIGSFLALFLFHQALGLPALLGILMVFGIVVSNAILLIDFVERNRADLPLEEALVMAGSVRVRPILMTAVATIAALLPVAAGISTSGGGGLISQSLALVVEGGLVSSTFLTLLVIPIVYSMLRRRGRRAVQLADRLDAA